MPPVLAVQNPSLMERILSEYVGLDLAGNLWMQVAWSLLLIAAVFVPIASVCAMFFIWWERKVAGHIQSRLGPNRVGPIGLLQSIADGIKLLLKEDLRPKDADPVLFRLAPYLAFAPVFAAFLALPFAPDFVFEPRLSTGVFWILAILALEVMGVILAGWASNNKWAVYGAMREACQMVSYEIPLGISIIIGVMAAGTLSLVDLGHIQGGGIHTWILFRNPAAFLAFFVYFVASLASNKRAPFDLPESESELVAGYHTEYSGLRFSFFFFAEYAAMFVIAGVQTGLFLGGWNDPFGLVGYFHHTFTLDQNLLGLFLVNGVGAAIFSAKCLTIVYVQMWIRWTLPRPRIDQVLYACVKVLLPLAFVLLLAAALWQLLVPEMPIVGWRGTLPGGEPFNPWNFSQWFAAGAGAALVTQLLLSLVGLTMFGAAVLWVMYAAGFDPGRKLRLRLTDPEPIDMKPESATS
jgi:NADH-quinone oxidoreductase subunit H